MAREWEDIAASRKGITLVGGFSCSLTDDEANEFHEFITQTKEWKELVESETEEKATRQRAAYETHRAAIVWHRECLDAMYFVSKEWFSGLVKHRQTPKE